MGYVVDCYGTVAARLDVRQSGNVHVTLPADSHVSVSG